MRDKPLILVVDDEPDLLEISSARLKASGYDVITAIDAETAYSKARKEHPDLVLLDIRMPGINGTEALLDFRNSADLKDTPVAFLTNLTVPWPGVGADNDKFAKELGAITLLDKSKDLERLPEIVEKLLKEVHKGELKHSIQDEVNKLADGED